MVQYSDYTDILWNLNFIGGAGKTALPNTSNDQRAVVDLVSGKYQFNYFIINNSADFNALAYYDTPTNDYGGDLVYDEQYTYFSADNSAFDSQHVIQSSIISSILSTSTYGSSFADVANIDFNVGAAANSEITFGTVTTGGSIQSHEYGETLRYISGAGAELLHGDIWLNDDRAEFWDDDSKGSAGYNAIQHEIGHALGLEGDTTLPAAIDSMQYTIMSYDAMAGTTPAGANTEVRPSGLQLLDIAAIQAIYGANMTTRLGDTNYSKANAFASTRPNESFIYTVWDAGGDRDTIDASGYVDGVTIDLREGEFSSIGKSADSNYVGNRGTGLADNNVAIAYNAEIEDAVGTNADDTITANTLNNEIYGNGGNDTIHLTLDNETDLIVGGTGSDTVSYLFATSGLIATTFDEFSIEVEDGVTTYDDINHVENFILTEYDDHFFYTGYGNAGNVVTFIDGKGGTSDDVTFETKITYNTLAAADEIWAGYQKVTLENVENINANASVHFALDENTTISAALNLVDVTGTPSNTIHTFDYQVSDNAINFSSSDTQNNIYGSDYGDTYDINSSLNIKSYRTGSGDDTLDLNISNGIGTGVQHGLYNIYYEGGNDTITISENRGSNPFTFYSAASVTLANTVDFTDVFVTDAGNQETLITIAGHGSILLDWNKSGVGDIDSLRVGLESGGYYEVDQSGVHQYFSGSATGASIEGTWEDDVLVNLDSAGGNIDAFGGDDVIIGGAGQDIIFAYDGNNTIDGGYGDDNLIGGYGDDTFIYDFASYGEIAPDVEGNLSGLDVISDNGGNDTLILSGINYSSGYEPYNKGGLGHFVIEGFVNHYDPNTGNWLYDETVDLITVENHYTDPDAQVEQIEFDDGIYDVLNDSFTSFTVMNGTPNVDNMVGTAAAEVINALADDDVVDGGAGADKIHGNEGDDDITGGQGNDRIYGGYSNYQGDSGTDIARYSGNFVDYTITTIGSTTWGDRYVVQDNVGTDGRDDLYGIETLEFADGSYDVATQVFTLNLNLVEGTSSNETINGTSDDDLIYGYGGNDTIYGLVGNDTIYGGDGNDNLYGGASNIYGGASGDNILYGEAGNDRFYLHGGNDYAYGGDGANDDARYEKLNTAVNVNLLTGEVDENGDGITDDYLNSIERVTGTNYDDTIIGDDNVNRLTGRNGDDTIRGGDAGDFLYANNGDDILYGDDGNDLLNGSSGQDTLYGGSGLDTLIGGNHADTFVFEAASAYSNVDVINDFDLPEGDVIDISDLLGAYDPLTDALSDFVSKTEVSGHTYFAVDADGGADNFVNIVRLHNVTGLSDIDTLETNGDLITS